MVNVQVATHNKSILVSGDRECLYRENKPPAFSDPKPFSEMAIRYEQAYGGRDETSDPDVQCFYARNYMGKRVALRNVKETVDRLPLVIEVQTTVGTVVGKQFTPSGKSYYTTLAGGREWVQSQQTPETYAVVVAAGSDRTAGVVSRPLYEALQPNDAVQVKLRRTRITKRLEAVEVTK